MTPSRPTSQPIETYPEMDKVIKDLLNDDVPHQAYAKARIIKLEAESTRLEAEVADLKRVCEYEHIPRFRCPKCNGVSYHDDHDDMSSHQPGGEDGTEPVCVSCPVNRCDNCQEIMQDPLAKYTELLRESESLVMSLRKGDWNEEVANKSEKFLSTIHSALKDSPNT